MDAYGAVRSYFAKMLGVPNPGIKILILDEETLGIFSVAMTFSEIMEREVFLVERIKSERDSLKHLNAVFFIRPSAENVSILSQELKNPRYASYYVFFSHALSKQALKQLAEADTHEVVSEVQEFFADFLALSPHCISIDRPLSLNSQREVRPEILTRSMHAITAALLALHRFPNIRYQSSSTACCSLAEAVRSFISREAVLFDFRKSDIQPVLVILDRRQDPVTPLLTQWTYEAMIHELIGIKHNRVEFASTSNAPESMRELTLSREFDEFFRNNQYMNFGEIGQSIKKLVNNFQNATKSVDAGNVNSVSDLKGLLENYPAFRKASGAVEMHVTIVSELSRLVKERSLMEVSELEQDLVCQDSQSSSFSRIKTMLSNAQIKNFDALRLVLLYALRFESHRREIGIFSSVLLERGVSKNDVELIDKIIDYAGAQRRVGNFDLFSTVKQAGVNASVANATSAVASMTKRLVKARKGVENVYTQHEPLIVDVLRELIRGQLKENAFPSLECGERTRISPTSTPAKEIIIFILGGGTYEESFAVQKLMAASPGVKILMAASFMHNSESFLEEVRATTEVTRVDDSVDHLPTTKQGGGAFPTALGFAKFNKTPSKSNRYSLLR